MSEQEIIQMAQDYIDRPLPIYKSTLNEDYNKAWKEYYVAVSNLKDVLKSEIEYRQIIGQEPYYARFKSPV